MDITKPTSLFGFHYKWLFQQQHLHFILFHKFNLYLFILNPKGNFPAGFFTVGLGLHPEMRT